VFLRLDDLPEPTRKPGAESDALLPPGVNPQGRYLVATATDTSAAEGPGSGNTSQFTSVAVFLGELTDELFQDRFEED
jgi:hypothetical protein